MFVSNKRVNQYGPNFVWDLTPGKVYECSNSQKFVSNFPWGHERPHTKFWPDRFSCFDVYWKQTNKQTDNQSIYIYCIFRTLIVECLVNFLVPSPILVDLTLTDGPCLHQQFLHTSGNQLLFLIFKNFQFLNEKKSFFEICES